MAGLRLPAMDLQKLKETEQRGRAAVVLAWLAQLQPLVVPANKAALKPMATELVKTITQLQLHFKLSSPILLRIGGVLAALFNATSTAQLSTCMAAYGNALRAKDDAATVPKRIASLTALRALTRSLGRALSPFIADLAPLLSKNLKNSDVQVRCNVLQCIEALAGKGLLGGPLAKDTFKALRGAATDRSLDVRVAAARASLAFASYSNYLQVQELDTMVFSSVRGLEGSDYATRRAVGKFLGALLASTQDEETWRNVKKASKKTAPGEMLGLLSNSFLKGPGVGDGLLKGDLLKSSSRGLRETRVGVAHAYVFLFQSLGATWVEKNVGIIVQSFTSLLRHPKASSSPAEARYAGQCVRYVYQNVLGKMLGEVGRLATVKELIKVISSVMNAVSENKLSANETKPAALVLACNLECVADLVTIIGSPTLALYDKLVGPILSVALHPSASARLAAAHCARCLGNAVPKKASFLANECLQRITKFRTSSDALHGTSYALAAVLGGSASCALGVPYSLVARVLELGTDLLKMKRDRSDVSHVLSVVSSAWALIGSLTSLGSAAVTPHLSKLVAMWGNVFEDAGERVKQRDLVSWRVELQERLGALTSMYGFLRDCRELVTQDAQRLITQRLLLATKMLAAVPKLSRSTQSLTEIKMRVRHRLFETFSLLPVALYEDSFSTLLPHLVSEISLLENASQTARSSLLPSLCHAQDQSLLDNFQVTDQDLVEAQLHVDAGAGLGAFENDPSAVFFPSTRQSDEATKSGGLLAVALPLPIETAVVDQAIGLFEQIFPCLGSQKHRFQLIGHFEACLKNSKAGARRAAMHLNVTAAIVSALRGVAQRRGSLGSEKLIKLAWDLLLGALGSPELTLRCAAGEGIARLCQTAGKATAVQSLSLITARVKSERDVVSRTATVLAMGCTHRYSASVELLRQLETTVGILHALGNDSNPEVQAWSLHGLTVVVDASGFDFSKFVTPTLQLVRSVLLNTPNLQIDVVQTAGKVLKSLIGALGPELQTDSGKRSLILQAYKLLKENADSNVRLVALECMQQLLLFSPKDIDVPVCVPELQTCLLSPHLLLRKTAANVLRQLVQRQPELVATSGADLIPKLFRMMDTEDDAGIQGHIREVVSTMLESVAAKGPSQWLLWCNDVLSGATEKQEVSVVEELTTGVDKDEDEDENDEDIDHKTIQIKRALRTVVPTRWQTKVFAAMCVREVVKVCEKQPDHFDAAKAQEHTNTDWLVNRLAELIRTAFMAATSSITQLREVGLQLVQDIISSFASSRDIDLGGNHSLLEQYQAQVTSALRPAFSKDTAPDVTTIACYVCGAWLSSGVNRKANDLQRVKQLLVTLLEGVSADPDPSYNERATTMLRLGLLSSWASVFIKAETTPDAGYLHEMLQPHLPSLRGHWFAALNDFAIVTLPAEYANQLPESGTFFSKGTRATVASYYENAFPLLVHAAALLMVQDATDSRASANEFYLTMGLCTRALCSRVAEEAALASLRALAALCSSTPHLRSDPQLAVELVNVLHHVMRTRGVPAKLLVIEVIQSLVGGKEHVVDDGSSIVPGSSPIYAILEICASTLLREMPHLNPDFSSSSASRTLSEESCQVVATTLGVFPKLLELCAPANRLQLLPSMLILLGGSLKQPETSLQAPALQVLHTIVCGFGGPDEPVPEDWNRVCHGALASILNCLEGALGSEDLGFLTVALGVMLSANPACALGTEKRCAAAVASLFRTSEAAVRVKALQVTVSLLNGGADAALAAPFVHAMAPLALDAVAKSVKTPPGTAEEVQVVQRAIQLLEAVLDKAPADQREGLVTIVVTVLVALLRDNGAQLDRASPAGVLHASALQALMKVGPAYPAEFKAIVTAAPQLKGKLEAAIRASRAPQAAGGPGGRGGQTGAAAASAAQNNPKIKLKMDFSAFGGASSS